MVRRGEIYFLNLSPAQGRASLSRSVRWIPVASLRDPPAR
jgi:hypothetical protein